LKLVFSDNISITKIVRLPYIIYQSYKELSENIRQASNNNSRTTTTPNNRIKRCVAAAVESAAIDLLNLGVDYKEISSILRIPLSGVSHIERHNEAKQKFLIADRLPESGALFAIFNSLPSQRYKMDSWRI
jgi:hypothetical protein